MRTFVILLFILAYQSTFAQKNSFSIKGIEIGKDNPYRTVTTVGGIQGVIIADTLNNGHTYKITFTPSSDGYYVDLLKQKEVKKFIKRVKKHYGIKLYRYSNQEFSGFDYSTKTKGYEFNISVFTEYGVMSPTENMVFSIKHMGLSKLKNQEIDVFANTDF